MQMKVRRAERGRVPGSVWIRRPVSNQRHSSQPRPSGSLFVPDNVRIVFFDGVMLRKGG